MSCPFCVPKHWEVFYQGPLVLGLWNAYPVAPGHALLVTRRHVKDWFEATPAEQAELMAAATVARGCIEERHRPDGYNLGLNCGEAAGQTVFHLHLHVLPRYSGVRPSTDPETDQLVPGSSPPHLNISNILDTVCQCLQSALEFDLCCPRLLLIFGAVEDFLKRGGHLRAIVTGHEGVELRRRYPEQVKLYRAAVLPTDYFRVRATDGKERAWMGGPAWHYELTGRDGQREVRRAFEAILTQPVEE